jgi:hypothetical protein
MVITNTTTKLRAEDKEEISEIVWMKISRNRKQPLHPVRVGRGATFSFILAT